MLVCISIELLQPSFELVHQFPFFDKAKLLQTSPLLNPEHGQTQIALTN